MSLAITTRALLLTGIALLPTTAFAQTADPAAPPAQEATAPVAQEPATPDAAATPEDEAAADIVVTGSRIQRPNDQAPNPITSLDAANIQQSGNVNLTDFLQRVPALNNSRDRANTSGGDGTQGTFGQTGLNQLNLRNLGTNRTLVLVDGRRHVAGEANTAAVDINSIPTDLVQRVDVLTGAVGAVYGADGVTGVVNFIMRKDFDGLLARSQFGISENGDAANRFASVVAGKNFSDGRGNVTLAYEYNHDDAVQNDDRRFLQQSRRKYLIPNDADPVDQSGKDNPNLPDQILVGDLRYGGESPIGAVFIGPEGSPSLDGLGRAYDDGSPAAYYRSGGISTGVAGFYQGDLFPKVDRHAVNLLSHYDFSDAFKLSIEGKFVQNKTSSFGQYTGTYYYPISIDNPFVPTNVRNAAIAAGTTTNGVFTPAEIHINRDNLDYGRQGEADRRRTYRGVIDLSGEISDHATWDAYYEYGRTDIRITKLNDRLGKNYADAIDARRDASGQIVCNPANNPDAGCIPLSVFGPGPASAAQLAFFQRDHNSSARVTQQVANASVSGDFGAFFELPGGPIRFAFGGEYRRESSRFDPNSDLVNVRFFQYDEPGLISPSRGHFDVKEVFGELQVPLLKDLPFAEQLSVGAAGRYSDYSTIGGTRTWQFNGTYAPIRDITVRGSYGKSVRAPNIGELFQPTFGTAEFITDPCTPDQINGGTQYRAANCATTLAAVGAVPAASLQQVNNVNGISSGNPNLDPEKATTWTAGVLLRPRFLPNFTASADWYDIKLKGAINTIGAGALVTLCVDQQTVPNQFCDQFTRAQGTGIVNSFTVAPVNVAQFRTAGLDINLDYRLRSTTLGEFDLRAVLGYLNRLETIGIPGGPIINQRDQSYAPKWTANFSPSWSFQGVTVAYNLRWNNATRVYSRLQTAANPDIADKKYLRYSELWQHDLQVAFETDHGFDFYTGVTNLTNQKPDDYSFSTSTPISPLGRYFYAGAKVRFGNAR